MERTAQSPCGPSRASEAELVERAQARETGAWNELVRRHQETVFRLALLLTCCAADAADVAQETFLKAFAHLNRFDRDRPLRPWLLRIARRQAGNLRRSAGRYLRTLARWVPEPDETAAWQPAGDLWSAMGRLGPGHRHVLYLRYFLELNEAETAEVLGIATGTVKSRHARALARLEAIIAADYPALRPDGGTDG